ncbi:MAG: serine/threonine protein kinase, partial [Deltaproteobacteria bacterium]|nr:serine/threonine protein kinase [Deltaproteobacteria bacterium]
MAEVWGAVHERQGARAAVKILTGDAILNPVYLALFRNEVRGIAGLDHSRIVRVYDHGLLTPEAAEASGGTLEAGSPWLAMERLDGGTLSDYAREGVDWDRLCAALLATLDGLAHAHARGVVHRDIKPGNVLLGVHGEIKLTDFGLVHAIATVDEVGDSLLLGTPAYMAPEQLQMRARDFGPWTDLYAVGCMAWALATGAPPFGRELKDALKGHLHLEPPAFTPDMRVPPDFERWVRWLLTKPVEQRVSRAAEASDTLAALSGRPRPGWRAGWRRPESKREGPLHGVGLGLLGVRSVPLVGREPEQDFLWDKLVTVDRDASPQVVMLRGGAGYGKSRLARW